MTRSDESELEEQLALLSDPKAKIEMLLIEGNSHYYTDPLLAYTYAERGLQIAEEIGDEYWIARMLYARRSFGKMAGYIDPQQNLDRLQRAALTFEELGEEVWLAKVMSAQADEYQHLGEYERARELCERAVTIFKRVGDKKNWAESLYRFAQIYHAMGSFPQAVSVAIDALYVYTVLNDVYGKGRCYNILGGVYMAMSEPKRALEYYSKGMGCMKGFGQPLLEAIGLINIGNAYMDLNRCDEALKNYQYAQQVLAKLGVLDREAVVWMQIGQVHEERAEWRDTILCYKRAEKLLRRTDNKERWVSIYRNFTTAYHKQKRWKMAKRYGEKALREAEKMGRLSEQYLLHQQMSEICEQLGEVSDALMHHKRYAEQREEVLGTEKQNAIAEMQAKFDVENAEREKELFRVKNVELTAALEEVRRLNDRLTKLNTEKNEVLGVVAHDLQGPLSGVKLVAEMVQAHYKQMPDVELEHQLGTIAQTSERMLSIATALLQAQALEQQEAGSELRERVDVSEEVRSVLERFRASAHRKGIELECSVPSGAVELECNRSGLQQVLENLLSNGIKFSPHGKRVGIEVKLRGGRVQIGVWDEGPGISTKDKRKLFGKFSRLSALPTGGESSTGLGLWIVKQRISQLGGSIRCISKAGAGARFVVELPE